MASFYSNAVYNACCIARLQPVTGLIYSVLLLELMLMLLYDSQYIIVGTRPLRGHRLGERKLRVLHCSSWTVLNARCTGYTVLLKNEIVINDTILLLPAVTHCQNVYSNGVSAANGKTPT